MFTHNIPRIVIAAPKGRSGKTTITLGILAALTETGLTVQPFKKGPDYIDPSWMTMITGRPCRNLDSVLMSEETILGSFVANAKGADIGLVEGAMGLYDGLDLEGSGSTAQIAKIIDAPIIFVIDCTRMTRSIAATVLGYQHFDRDINIHGIILNKVSGARHERILRGAIETYCQTPVIGCIPKRANMIIPDRHLGLVPANETDRFNQNIKTIGQVITDHTDLQQLLTIAKKARPLGHLSENKMAQTAISIGKPVNIGVICDQAFSFYYPENLQQLEKEGANLIKLNSLRDTHIEGVDALYIGGGFPEVFGPQLARNEKFRHSIFRAINQGLPVYAECGGLMYLGRKVNYNGIESAMVGALPFDVSLEKKHQGHGYTAMRVITQNSLFQVGDVIRGHEFHHSRLTNVDETKIAFAFKVERGNGIDGSRDGIIFKNVFATYTHIHALASPQWAKNFVKLAWQYKHTAEHSII